MNSLAKKMLRIWEGQVAKFYFIQPAVQENQQKLTDKAPLRFFILAITINSVF